MSYEAIKKQMNDTLPLVRHLSIQIQQVGDGTSQVLIPDLPELRNHIGTLHAGAMFSVAETASGAAMAGALAPFVLAMRPVAKQGHIAYTKVAKGAITAHGKVQGDAAQMRDQLQNEGKVLVPVVVDLIDETSAQVAQVQVEWHVSLKK